MTCGADVARQLRRQELDHHLPMQRSLGGEEQAAHAATTELLLDAVGVAEGTSFLHTSATYW